MESEEKKDDKEFGKVIDALHSKQKLPSLRTYQGDMAQFIKEKNESVISVAVKSKELKEKKEKEKEAKEKVTEKQKDLVVKSKPKVDSPERIAARENLKRNIATVFLSLLLLSLTGGIGFVIYKSIKTPAVSSVVVEQEIIPYSNSTVLTGVTKENLGAEISKIPQSNGINFIKISDANGNAIKKSTDFFNLIQVSLPSSLSRNIKNDFFVGLISRDNTSLPFMIITVSDYGSAFSSMLDWESNMEDDLSFLVASSTNFVFPDADDYSWRDLIIKNKDTRGLVNSRNKSKIAYTFLDKNTILIVGDTSAIGDISAVYASRSIAR